LIGRRKFERHASCGQSQQQNDFRQHLRVLMTTLYLMTYLDKQTRTLKGAIANWRRGGSRSKGAGYYIVAANLPAVY
jgi:hypothetical protein